MIGVFAERMLTQRDSRAVRSVTHFALVLLCIPCLFSPLLSCTHQPQFPDNGRPAIVTTDQFAWLSHPAQSPINEGVRIAGRLVRAETTGQGVKILAEWLPFPTGPYDGPGGDSQGERYRFYALFQGAIDEQGLERGNEFVLTGRVSGQEDLMTLQGALQQVPVLLAECLHVWKTAGTDLREYQEMAPVDLRYPPPLEETYCTASQL